MEDNRIPENGTPGYVTLHLRGAFRVGNKITARLALDNLTDELVLEHGSGFYRPGFSATSSLDVSLSLNRALVSLRKTLRKSLRKNGCHLEGVPRFIQ
ncbi:TonB-dependent receptor [Sorangium cellulosum]|uniref:TonB-dependent receptor n=1 Tax=Sorangium cellulosum TaxID=56 RepID=UPI00165121F4